MELRIGLLIVALIANIVFYWINKILEKEGFTCIIGTIPVVIILNISMALIYKVVITMTL